MRDVAFVGDHNIGCALANVPPHVGPQQHRILEHGQRMPDVDGRRPAPCHEPPHAKARTVELRISTSSTANDPTERPNVPPMPFSRCAPAGPCAPALPQCKSYLFPHACHRQAIYVSLVSQSQASIRPFCATFARFGLLFGCCAPTHPAKHCGKMAAVPKRILKVCRGIIFCCCE